MPPRACCRHPPARTELLVLSCAEALFGPHFHRCADSVNVRKIQQSAFVTGSPSDSDKGGLVLGNISLRNGSLGMRRGGWWRGGDGLVMLPEGRGARRGEDRRQEVRGVLQRKEVHQRQNFGARPHPKGKLRTPLQSLPIALSLPSRQPLIISFLSRHVI